MKDVLPVLEFMGELGSKTNDYKTICQILSTRFYQDTKVGQLTQSRGEKGPQVGET